MFNSHLFKVIVGFCGMIILGLGLLVIIDSFKESNASATPTVKDPLIVEKATPSTKHSTKKTSTPPFQATNN